MTLLPKQKFLLVAPLIVLPFLCLIFYTLGGGRAQANIAMITTMGLNKQLPGAWPNTKQPFLNKMAAYKKADQDSARKRQWQQQDPYRAPAPTAHQLLEKLNNLRQSIQQPTPPVTPVFHPYAPPILPHRPLADTPENDPQLDRLNTMLDKVIRIQHPGENKTTTTHTTEENAEEVLPADSNSNAIAAIIPTDQTLTTGGTIALRLAEDIRIHGLLIPRGQRVYGVVTINGDRMQVHIRSLHSDRNLFNTDLQVYDLDGLPGIHIPGMISRDVAKESADEGVNSLDLTTDDPTIGAQAANAGIQAAKTLLGRKVRLVRVSVRAGYQVLLRGNRPISSTPTLKPISAAHQIQPPGIVPGGSFLQRCRTEGMELDLQGIYLKDSLLWIALRCSNRSPIGYNLDYSRWIIRDKRSFKRTAQQELPTDPVYTTPVTTISGDSAATQWVGFHPFAISKDKELVLEIGEKNGARTLTLIIDHKKLLKAKRYEEPE